MRRNGNPPLGIDPAHRVREKPVHLALQPLAPPHPSASCRTRRRDAFPASILPLRRGRKTANARPQRLPDWRTLHPDAERRLEYRNGISWGDMGVNGNRLHKHGCRNPEVRPRQHDRLYPPLRLTKRLGGCPVAYAARYGCRFAREATRPCPKHAAPIVRVAGPPECPFKIRLESYACSGFLDSDRQSADCFRADAIVRTGSPELPCSRGRF